MKRPSRLDHAASAPADEGQAVRRRGARGAGHPDKPPLAVSRSMMALLALIVLLPVLVLVAVGSDRRRMVLEEARRDAEATASIMQQHARRLFETQELVLELVADMISDMEEAAIASDGLRRQLLSIVARLDQTDSLWITNAEGDVLASTVPFAPGRNLADLESFREQRDRAQPRYIGSRYVSPATGRPSFAISRRRISPDGRFNGTIHAVISPEVLEEAFAVASTSASGAASLMRTDGLLLVRLPAGGEGLRLAASSTLVQAMARSHDAGVFRTDSSVDGVERLYAYRRVQPFPLYVSFGVDLQARLDGWWQGMLRQAATALAIILLLSGAAWMAWRGAVGRSRALAELRQEAELRHLAEAQLREARALEALGRMARGVAHDFNNLLTVVLGNLEALEEATMDPVLRGVAQRTRRAAEASAHLASSLLAYARTQVLRLQALPVGSLLQDMLPVLQDLATPAIEVRLQTEPELPRCALDPAQLQAAICNLVSNARDAILGGEAATRRPGRILIGAARAQLPDAGVSVDAPGFVAIAITDNGPGMSEDVAARAFEPFFTTKPAGAGSGLGLSQVFGLVTQLGGRMALRSAAGEGTTVTLYLPEARTPLAQQQQDPRAGGGGADAAMPPPGRAARILVVEDQPEIRAMIERMLARSAHRVQSVPGGREALALMQAGERFDLVLSDVLMPDDVEGMALAQRIHALRPETAVLLMSGYVPDGEVTTGAVQGFLRKPFTRRALQEAVQQALA
ncbi:ATP-binding protein [Falsiroseomonas tokyonensis]|uniref:histidine kinase n=1 Tax=Falsiroseomonas tokyonensis TaxID=430521 RepID=A0ABV7BZG3_9PROT|nr:ATP-binding protein [Falsiroseomonas tokyonensis]MBU8540944.1 response regulator [Falsiroseomonas tokyonensis]